MWICCNTNFTGSRRLGSPIKVTVQWEDERAREILRKKTEEVGYHLREKDQYEDQLNSIEEPDESKGKTLQEAYTGMVAVNTWSCGSHLFCMDTVNIVSENEAASSNKDGAAKARGMI